MFESLFQNAMALASRLLFAASLLMLAWGVVYAAYVLFSRSVSGAEGAYQDGWVGALLMIFATAFDPAAKLLFGAAVLYSLESVLRRSSQ